MNFDKKSKYLKQIVFLICNGMPVIFDKVKFVSERMDAVATGYCHGYHVPTLGNDIEIELYKGRDAKLLFQTIVHECHHACLAQINRLLLDNDMPKSMCKNFIEINADISGCLATNVLDNYDEIKKYFDKIVDK
jgi:hypothetical protein